LLVAAALSALEAQTNTGEVAGLVRDAQGGVLPGATVVAEHLDTGTRVERTSDAEGRHFLPSLRVGVYRITVHLDGFQWLVRESVLVRLGQALTLDFTLAVGGLTEEIRVSTEAPLLQAANAEISDVITNQQVVEIPLNGRNFLALAQLSDAVVIPAR
jgi:hypothetical protein